MKHKLAQWHDEYLVVLLIGVFIVVGILGFRKVSSEVRQQQVDLRAQIESQEHCDCKCPKKHHIDTGEREVAKGDLDGRQIQDGSDDGSRRSADSSESSAP